MPVNPIYARLTGYSSTTGTITSSDSVLTAIEKLNGNGGGGGGGVFPVPQWPTGLTVTPNYIGGSNALSWTAVTGAATYNVYRNTSAITGPWSSAITNTASTSYTDSGATLSNTNYYCVTALTSSGSGYESAQATPVKQVPAIVVDSFTGTSGTLLTSHTPDVNTSGNSWTNLYGSFKLDGSGHIIENSDTGAPSWVGSSNSATAYINVGTSNWTASVTHSWSGTTNAGSGIGFRLHDGNNMFVARFIHQSNTVSVLSMVGGSFTALYSGTTVASGGTISVTQNASGFTVSYNGSVVYTSTDTTTLISYANNVGVFFQNFDSSNLSAFVVHG